VSEQLPDVITTLTIDEAIPVVAGGCAIVLGGDPPAGCLATLVGQTALETGNYRHMHCWNPGNRKQREGDEYFCAFSCDEIFDPKTAQRARALGPCALVARPDGKVRVVLGAEHPWARFAAFKTAARGMADYVQLLACMDRYRPAWSRAYAGDPEAFVRALGRAGYFTANVDTYARAVVSIAARVLPACGLYLGTRSEGLTDEDRRHVAELVQLTLADSALGRYEHAPERMAA
jgi:hypothetical protein